jgi:hypothetical protein
LWPVVPDLDELGWRHGLFAVEVEIPLDRAFTVLFTHPAVCPQQQPESGVRAAFYAVGRGIDLETGELGAQVGEQRPGLAEPL